MPLGTWIHRVFTDEEDWRVERTVYRLVGVEPRTEQRWTGYAVSVIVFAVVSVVGLVVAFLAWPALGRVLLAYGLAARIPVVLVMLAAILGNWGTHYDVPPPGAPEMSGLWKWAVIGLLPQLTIWLWFTSVVGGIFGIVAGAIAGRRAA